MKKVLFLFLVLIAFSLNAQGRRDKQSSIHAEYGYTFPKDSAKAGFMAKVGYGRVFGNKGILGKAELFYQNYEVGYLDQQILPYNKFGLNVNAGYSLEALYPVLINVYAGGFAGYETVNDGNDKDPKYNATIPYKIKGFTYGVSGSVEMEIFLIRNLSLLVDYTQFYDLKSKFSKSNYGVFGGLKYSIN